MKVVGLETVRVASFPALLFLQVHTDEGVIGLGETCLGSAAVEAHVHEAVAPALLGGDPLRAEYFNRLLYDDFVGFADAGVATRARSALDIALWDIIGQAGGQPLYQLLGGRFRASAPVYNTCAGPGYGASGANVDRAANWTPDASGRYEDLHAVLTDAGGLARELLAEGTSAMKFWPLDGLAMAGEGRRVVPAELERALRPLAAVREAVGAEMRVMIDLHGMWRMPAVLDVISALNDFDPFWIEDPVKADDFGVLAKVAARSAAPIAAGETLAGRETFDRLIREAGLGVVMFDPGWAGGVSEIAKISVLADTHGLPVAPHDCTGPVGLTVGSHLCVSAPNALIQETVRAFVRGWYRDLVTDLPDISAGQVRPPDGPGLGTRLRPDLRRRADVRSRMTGEAAAIPVPGTDDSEETDDAHVAY